MAEHLDKLCRDLTASGNAELELDVDDISLPTEHAIPASVIVNELVHEAPRHRVEGGSLRISLNGIQARNIC
ncbi:hypothetical protein [Agrobacterium rosae]|uniref:hypothetical protein n=1 Tax=Agrobacterium rosae TaxID=1972867 RepID=UPI00203378BF|nr:hypothetical protein [Agrobacterium rosae]MCM2435850.1 hypothetical protein [Agrobacterium rosae]